MIEEKIMPIQPELLPDPDKPQKRRGRPPKYDVSKPLAGRPPRNPLKKVGTPYRFLTTSGMNHLLKEFQKEHNLTDAGGGRLMLYLFLIVMNLWQDDFYHDGTFEEMRKELASSPTLGDLVRAYHGKELVDRLYEYFQLNKE